MHGDLSPAECNQFDSNLELGIHGMQYVWGHSSASLASLDDTCNISHSLDSALERCRKKLKAQVFSNGFEVHRLRDSPNPGATQAKPGKKVTVKYKGTLKNGKVFDETKGNKTFQFRLGTPTPPTR